MKQTKKIFLTRHAKSDWGHEGLKDIDRPLNQRGYDDAYRMVLSLKKKELVPELLVTSPAVRAVSTAFIFARGFGIDESMVKILPGIYETDVHQLKDIFEKTDNSVNSVMMFGHNPVFTQFFNEICDSEIDNIPTCGVMIMEFSTSSWKTVFEKQGKFVLSEFPKDFKS